MYLNENRLGGNEVWCEADNHDYMYQIGAFVQKKKKRIFIFKLLKFNSYWQHIKFSQNGPKFHIRTKIVILKV